MAKQAKATIVSYCAACGELIEAAVDWSSEDGYWRPPEVGHQIEADMITSVRQVQPLRSTVLPCFVVELDTKVKPHCEAAKR